ncbi:MAG: hypothetical protein AAFN30_18385, partial [Actinomycetota bacterium]
MNRWFNPSHPQTLQAAVILGYFSAVFGLLGAGVNVFLLLFIGVGVGAFGSANNQRWGYYLLAGCSLLIALFWLTVLILSFSNGITSTQTFWYSREWACRAATASAVGNTVALSARRVEVIPLLKLRI